MNSASTDAFERKLFAEKDGSKFHTLLQKLIKTHAANQREQVITILIKYAKEGQLLHWRNMLLTDLIELIEENETQYIDFFEWAITVPKLAYWGIDGLLKTAGKAAYTPLVALINNEKYEVEDRAKAIKSIAVFSKQAFDSGLPSDPGYWKARDFKLADILAWQKNNYADGVGYSKPKTHASLENPKTAFEKIVAKLAKKLAKKRAYFDAQNNALKQDAANPTSWLVIAEASDISNIKAKWKLPTIYLEFLTNYSPLQVSISYKKFIERFSFNGAHELIGAQDGYAYNSIAKEIIKDWPKNYVVIGNDAGDPYCIDIGDITDGDAPIYTAEHGAGKWDFELVASSFTEFLKMLVSA
jgi:hypothetical protein